MACDAYRQAPRTRQFAGRDIGAVGENLDCNDQRGILKVYFKSDFILDRGADRLIDFH